jgi:hypothetical protein
MDRSSYLDAAPDQGAGTPCRQVRQFRTTSVTNGPPAAYRLAIAGPKPPELPDKDSNAVWPG